MDLFDCIIVGAGPAGGAAAYHLAKAGRKVLVLEKEALPRYKPCGGGIPAVVGEWFDFDFSPAISSRATTVRYTWNMDETVEVALAPLEPIWMVRREIFDHFLVQQAQRQGAELRTPCEVRAIAFQSDHWQVTTPEGPVAGRYLIAADGAKGPMARWLGFKTRKHQPGGALEAEALGPVPRPEVAHFEFGMVKKGYLWNFPKADGHSIGIGHFRGGKAQNLRTLRELARQYSTLFGVDFQQVQHYGHPLCLWDGDQVLHTQNAILAGEAACLVDPFTAEGIRPSIFSGIKAAAAIDAALAGDGNALERYTQVIQAEWGADLRWARRLATVFYQLPRAGYRFGVQQPKATHRMAKVLCGELRYRDVVGGAMRRMGVPLSLE